MIGLSHYLTVAAILFTLGVLGIFVNRKNVIVILMSVELILLAVNINLVAFSTHLNDITGQVFALFVLTVAAAESAIGLAILVIYLLYHPKPPRLHVSTATLNAGYIDELPPPHLGQALNSDLYVLAAIYNPNTKIDVALHYMQFDLYFQGHLIGKQAVWPPLYESPGDSALRTVHLVVSEVVMRPEDADVWKNVTSSGGLVQMQLEGRFYVQLNFGRWLPFRYMVKPSCALWLDPPPAGALRRARCRQ